MQLKEEKLAACRKEISIGIFRCRTENKLWHVW